MSDSVLVFSLPQGYSALVINEDGSEVSVKSNVCSECGGVECGIPASTVLATTIAMLIETDPHFREFLEDASRRMLEGAYVPLTFREDCH